MKIKLAITISMVVGLFLGASLFSTTKYQAPVECGQVIKLDNAIFLQTGFFLENMLAYAFNDTIEDKTDEFVAELQVKHSLREKLIKKCLE